ncbi:hypothetical protein [Streptomyces phaeoluteigriseus]|uniref:hypothetical protein n=1 Tax=Streptomyces phaeoluteigriseus TaxID=114686 RepID=UPI0036C95EAE
MEELITIVGTVEDPRTSPQDRQGVVETAESLSTALAAISAPATPSGLRKELTTIVKQGTSTLEAVNGPETPTEERSMIILVVKRTTSTLEMVCDPQTPQDARAQMIAIVQDTTYAAEKSQDGAEAGSVDASRNAPESESPKQFTRNNLVPASSSSDIMQDRRTPPKEREQLGHITRQVSALLKKISDPRTSQEERSEARKELDDRSARMKDQQQQSVSAQERPQESLGKAAAFCTSAIFESTPESTLVRRLNSLVPPQWKDEGVKDFWKAEDMSNDMLRVHAQLRNNEQSRGPFEIVRLITELAEVVPHDRLFGDLSGAALACEQTAKYLDEEFGVTAGTWLTRAGD